MKKFIIVLAMVTLGFSSAYAMPMMMDPSQLTGFINTGDGNTMTTVFNQLGVYAETDSFPTGLTTFQDIGNLAVTSIIPSGDTENMNNPYLPPTWELTGQWLDLVGTMSAPSLTSGGQYVVTYTYTGGNLVLKGDTSWDHNFRTPELGSSDDDFATFVDGDTVATLTLESGIGHLFYNDAALTDPDSGDILLGWKFQTMMPNFWRDAAGNDLSPYVSSIPGMYIVSLFDSNTHDVFLDVSGQVPHIYSNHNGSASIDKVIPEPASMLLLGMGVLGLVPMVRRKKTA